MNNTFSENLKKIRKENNLSQEQLAEKLFVSRQSISKWESNQAYPEMDKILQLCKLFNLNIDDLLNRDIKEVKKEKESKININKYIEDFLSFITNTINMFVSMNFKTKIKLIFEEITLSGILALIFLLVGYLLSNIFRNMFYIIKSDKIYYYLRSLSSAIYILAAVITSVAILIYVFKTRYLDYYLNIKQESLKEKELKEEDIEGNNKKETKLNFKKEEKIVIRDPKHSEYKFINGLLKISLLFVKLIVATILLFFLASLLFLITTSVISFLILKSGIFFLGGLTLLIGLIILNVLIVSSLFNFIFSRKSNKRNTIYITLASVLITGVGIGLLSIGIFNFELISSNDPLYYKEETKEIEMDDSLLINNHDVNYIESDNNNLIIKYKVNKYNKTNLSIDNNWVYISAYIEDPIKAAKEFIKNINSRKIISIDNYIYDLEIYTNKDNIEKLKQNIINVRMYTNEINDLNDKIIELEEIIRQKEEIIYNQQESNYYE